MVNIVLGAFGSFVAIVAFATLIETPKKYLLHAGITGAVGGFVYLLCMQINQDPVLSSFLSALAIAFTSHIFARIFKAPVTIFMIAGMLPTVPGAGMYKIVYYIIAKDNAMCNFYFIQTLEIAGMIALAIFIVDGIFKVHLKKQIKW